MTMQTAQIIYTGELRTTATHLQSGTVIETDAPVDNNGKGERFSPTDLVATALGSCMLTIMGITARQHQWQIEGTRVGIQKIMGTEPRRITGVKVIFDFPEGHNLGEKEKTILERAALTCPVAKSVHPDMLQDVTFNW
jgi:putative redox protein